MIDQKKSHAYTERFYGVLTNAFLDKKDKKDIKTITNVELTQDFKEVMLGILFAYNSIFCDLTNEDRDVLEFTHILNLLAVEYLMEYGSLYYENMDGNLENKNNNLEDEKDDEESEIRSFTNKYLN